MGQAIDDSFGGLELSSEEGLGLRSDGDFRVKHKRVGAPCCNFVEVL